MSFNNKISKPLISLDILNYIAVYISPLYMKRHLKIKVCYILEAWIIDGTKISEGRNATEREIKGGKGGGGRGEGSSCVLCWVGGVGVSMNSL